MFDVNKILGKRSKKTVGFNMPTFKMMDSFSTLSQTVAPPKQNTKIKKNYSIDLPDRETLDGLAKRRMEFGGGIDFNNRGVERIEVYRGNHHSIILPEDYEVGYHTHPIGNQSNPSAEDILAISENRKQQAELILSSKDAIYIRKTPQSMAWYRANKDTFSREYNKLRSSKDIINYLKRAGFEVILEKRGRVIPVRNISIVEYSRFW